MCPFAAIRAKVHFQRTMSNEDHAPIIIFNDIQYELPKEISGVTSGSGTPEDPYIIEGWRIRSTGAPVDLGCIRITGTKSHVIVRNCHISGGGWETGIYLTDSCNVLLSNNTIESLGLGIYLYNSTKTTMSGNSIANCGHGTEVVVSEAMVSGNTFSSNNVSICYWDTKQTDFKGIRIISCNYISGCRIGMFCDSLKLEISNNTLCNNTECGIYIGPDGDSVPTIAGNKIMWNKYGIFCQSSRAEITSNEVAFNTEGIISKFFGVNIEGTLIHDNNVSGITCVDSDSRISNNTIASNFCGIFAMENSYLNISYNNISNNTPCSGIDIRNSNATIWYNNIVGNRNCLVF